tara:strand:- start:144 stop:344 length:201 start_codon:yes stop_codon:yes gene_type:complete
MANFMQTLTNFESSCVDELQLDPETGEAKVTFINGNSYNYFDVSKYAIKRLLESPNSQLVSGLITI